MFQNNASLNQEARIKGIMNYYKNFSQNDNKYSFEIPFTRTELAAFTGYVSKQSFGLVKRRSWRKSLR